MLLIQIDHNKKIPVYMQVVEELIRMIDGGVLNEGQKLPSTRKLAQQTGINRTTICKAYDELWSLGYIESQPGAYSMVRKRVKPYLNTYNSGTAVINWDKHVTINGCKLKEEINRYLQNVRDDYIDFHSLSPDPQLIPWEELRKSLNKAIANGGSRIFTYGQHAGYDSLRETLAVQMQKHKIKVTKEEVLITNGTQNSLDLLLKMMLNTGKKVVVENPTYKWAASLLKFYGAEIISVPHTVEGMDLDILENVLSTNNIAFIYTMSNFHNPTGVCTSQEHREKFICLCEKYKVPVVEDGFEEEMKYFGKAILPLKALDKNKVVIYLGTFSKVLAPGMRIGWIAADEKCIKYLEAIKGVSDLGTNTPMQVAVNDYIISGNFDKHLYRIHKNYRKRMSLALKCLRINLNNVKVKYQKPLGGYTIWFTIAEKAANEKSIVEEIKRNGVIVTPGSLYFQDTAPELHFRISIAHANENDIENGIEKLTEVLNKV